MSAILELVDILAKSPRLPAGASAARGLPQGGFDVRSMFKEFDCLLLDWPDPLKPKALLYTRAQQREPTEAELDLILTHYKTAKPGLHVVVKAP